MAKKLGTSAAVAVLLILPRPAAHAQKVEELPEITVSGAQEDLAANSTDSSLGASSIDKAGLASKRPTTSDSTRLLEDIPGVSLYGAGGISSLPVIHGLADDRLRVQVDGMDLMPACPNHMNSVLSYIDPTKVATVTVFAGVSPVSVGGDSIGGTTQVKSAPPEFARAGETVFVKGMAADLATTMGQRWRDAGLASPIANRAHERTITLRAGTSSQRHQGEKAAR